MHTHACPLYSLTKLIGIEFTESGVMLSPKLPLPSFRFDSPLLGLIKTAHGYEGWYAPAARNNFSIRLVPAAEELKHLQRVEVNGNKIRARIVDNAIELRGIGGGGTPST